MEIRQCGEKRFFATRALILMPMVQPEILLGVHRIIAVNAYIRIIQSVLSYILHIQTVQHESAFVIMDLYR